MNSPLYLPVKTHYGHIFTIDDIELIFKGASGGLSLYYVLDQYKASHKKNSEDNGEQVEISIDE